METVLRIKEYATKVMFGMLALAGDSVCAQPHVISVLPDEVNQGQIFRIIFFGRQRLRP
jgi:hypothetical protein